MEEAEEAEGGEAEVGIIDFGDGKVRWRSRRCNDKFEKKDHASPDVGRGYFYQ